MFGSTINLGKRVFVNGSWWDDNFTYNMTSSQSKKYSIDGGWGCDTLTLEFTREQWMSSTVQSDMARLKSYLDSSYSCKSFSFNSFDLDIDSIEKAKIIVDGRELSLADDAVRARDDSFTVTENTSVRGSVVANDSVPDLVRNVVLLDKPSAGQLNFQTDGTFEFTAGNSFDYLRAGEKTTVYFSYKVTDADGDCDVAKVAITVVGTNDAAVIGNVTNAIAVEDKNVADGNLVAKGKISISDLDQCEAEFSTAVTGASGNVGTLVLKANGEYAYSVKNAQVQYLAEGQVKVDSFTIKSVDGITKVVDFKIVGTNDAAVIGNASTTVVEDQDVVDGNLSAKGTISISDADQGEAAFSTVVTGASGNLGSLMLRANGEYDYAVKNALVQHLAEGEVKVDSFTVTSVDGTTKVVEFKIVGTNDAPVAKNDAFTVADEGRVTLDVLVNDTDIDGGPLAVQILSQPKEGTISIDASGRVVFDPGTTFAKLSTGQAADVSFDYKVSDGLGGTSTATATIHVEGAGLFVPPLQTQSQTVALKSGAPTTLSMTGPAQTGFVDGKIDLDLSLGAVGSVKKNFFYVVDISGSTNDKFGGTAVGDLNGKGGANTILDAEIDGLLKLNKLITDSGYNPDDVTITVVPFNSKADPADWVSSGPTPNLKTTTFDLGSASIDNFLRSLDNGGGTNYEEALQAVIDRLKILDPHKTEGNYVYFLSDGAPNPVNSFADEAAILKNDYRAQISAIGLGPTVPLQYLDIIDNTGGAERVTSTDQFSSTIMRPLLSRADVIDVDIFVNGVEISDLGIDRFVQTPNGLAIRFDVASLKPILGDTNKVFAEVEFSDHTIISTELVIDGVLPTTTTDFLI